LQQVIRVLVNWEEKERIEREAKRLGLKSSEFLRLLIKLHFNGLRLEARELAEKGKE